MKPFVKWAGGKTRLLSELERSLPIDFDEWEDVAYVEPFVGGGAFLFHMLKKHRNLNTVIINDINKTLVNAYRIIKQDPTELISEIKSLDLIYNSKKDIEEKRKFYYLVRDLYNTVYNNIDEMPIQRLACFFFLNQTCFNGLYRENKKGFFNVPYGNYINPNICNEERLWEAHKVLANVTILEGDFNQVGMNLRNQHVFFYLDPPYKPISETSTMFTSYDRSGFNDEKLLELKAMCDQIHANGWKFMMSNSDSKTEDGQSYFENLYRGYLIKRINVTRLINTYNASQRRLMEVLITNY